MAFSYGKACPKGAMKSRLAEQSEKDKADEKALDVWRKALRTRDEGRCRVCRRKTVKSFKQVPNRGEGHHIAGRAAFAQTVPIQMD